ncbi:glycosyltransferase family 39 protein [bacterium]|nr:glycosyltransferase family 39 protein [bacterium]
MHDDEPGGPRRASYNWTLGVLVAYLVLAAILRCFGLTWGFPYSASSEECLALEAARHLGAGPGGLDGSFSAFGTLPLYLTLLGAGVVRVLGSLGGHVWAEGEDLLLAGRGLSAVADLICVYLVFLIGRRGGRQVALWGAALYAVALIGVRASHFAAPAAVATCVLVLYVYAILRLAEYPSPRAYALTGLALGAVAATRLVMVPVAVLGLVVLALQIREASHHGGDPRPFRMAAAARWIRGGLAAFVVLCLLPVSVWEVGRRGFKTQMSSALVDTVDSSRIDAHSPEFWASQVDSVYNGIALVLMAVAVVGLLSALGVLLWISHERGPRTCYEAFVRLRNLGLHLGVAAGVFLVLTPAAVLHPLGYWAPAGPGRFTWNLLVALGALRPWPVATLHFAHTWPVVYQLLHVWPYAFGVPLALLLLGALVWGLVALLRGTAGSLWPVALGALLVTGAGSLLSVKTVSYLSPAAPLLCVLAGAMIASWYRGASGLKAWGVSLSAGLVVLLSLAWTVGYLGIYRVPDNRLAAIEWLASHARPGELVLVERDEAWSPDLLAALKDRGPYRVERYEPLAVMQDRPEGWNEDDVRAKRAYLQSRLSEADWLVLTDTNRSRMATLKRQFPVINDFYEGLRQKRTPFTEAAAFAAGPSLLGLTLEDSGAELSFRMADHPTVRLYRRTAPAPQAMPAASQQKRPNPVTKDRARPRSS